MQPVIIKSKERVQKHGEVFTPDWIVDKMLDLVPKELNDTYATFLEPAAGEGAFLTAILQKKLLSVKKNYSKNFWKSKSLFALSSIYGIELLEDNLYYARKNMLEVFVRFHEEIGSSVSSVTNLYKAARFIIEKNIVLGNTLMRLRPDGQEIRFSEWRRVKGAPSKVERIPFTYSSLFEEVPDIQPDLIEIAGQLNLFEDEHVGEARKYKIVDIQHVFKEEME